MIEGQNPYSAAEDPSMTSVQKSMIQPTKDKFEAHPSNSSYTWVGTQIHNGVYDMDYDDDQYTPDADLCLVDGQQFYSYFGGISNTGGSRGGYNGAAWGKCVCD
ncbi:hypothetical protein [Erythrobacter aureus]|uniref:Uncharacterized protein n=1 Tax=Erythrobacter aureus TaxID=2182384 RepID=A0A345YJ03_9SPHN|nr:hypothetical protein [Erythrobacter aureus]AXK43905.1 hypothetical protein DVR09_15740 [Erythrobacter aureus]